MPPTAMKFDDAILDLHSQPSNVSYRVSVLSFDIPHNHRLTKAACGTKRHCTCRLMLCPELKELRTPIKGLSNLDTRLIRQLLSAGCADCGAAISRGPVRD